MTEKLLDQLKVHEGLRLEPYRCTAGKLTIGYGRNLESFGISEEEAEAMLVADVERVCEQLHEYEWFEALNKPRQAVCINMAFNLGVNGFAKFRKMIGHLEEGRYAKASYEMINSRWANQVGNRAQQLSRQMLRGEWQ